MSTSQKAIKYVAQAFAILLAVTIISAIGSLVVNVISSVTGHSFIGNRNTINLTKDFENVRSLKIDHSFGNLTIKSGDTFRVEAKNVSEDFRAEVSPSGTLTLDENNNRVSFMWFNFSGFGSFKSHTTVYLPEDFTAKLVELDSGAGNVTIEDLATEKLILNAGAGNVVGSNVLANGVEIDGGVGNITLLKVLFKDANINSGVGNLKLSGQLVGENKIDGGVGSVHLNLNGEEEDYNIKVESGIGKIRVNGEKISREYQSRKGIDNSIYVNAGLGNVRINFDD